ncbi:hypothetical protein [Criblamydia sequanensis]|uniref:Threonyl-tRNA synthetase n=1 Tax=Candidatus Criblamydia sequanensis CRIB-18 TaxID=1437425 RepID=A0A090DWZ3_9BACT|nr:hypothetical protein [Criblamydia sequanensis]CDR33354.1 Putative threonyl-tRNA synthetase [Criblamydia sequanensis CRIB-18]
MKKPSIIQASAKILLALAVKEIFPKVRLAGGGSNSFEFYYDFINLSETLDAKALEFIEDRLNRLLNEKISFSTHEMVFENAKKMFLQEKFMERVAQLERCPGGLIPLVRVKNFWDVLDHPVLDHSGEIKAIKLLGFKNETIWLPEGKKTPVIRILGLAAETRDELKKKVKERSLHLEKQNFAKALKLGLVGEVEKAPPGVFLFKSEGVEVVDRLKNYLKKASEGRGLPFLDLELVRNWKGNLKESLAPLDLLSLLGPIEGPNGTSSFFEIKRVGEHPPRFLKNSLYQPLFSYRDESYIFCSKEKLQAELNSSLQFIQENVNISGTESKWQFVRARSGKQRISLSEKLLETALVRSQVEWEEVTSETAETSKIILNYKDVFGDLWEGPFIEVLTQLGNSKGDSPRESSVSLIRYSLLGSLERFLAFWLERHGSLPLALMPWHGRIEFHKKEFLPIAEKIKMEAIREGVRLYIDRSEDLTKKVNSKLEMPFNVLISGQDKDQITLQAKGFSEEKLEVREIIERIAEALRIESVPTFLRDQRRYNKD